MTHVLPCSLKKWKESLLKGQAAGGSAGGRPFSEALTMRTLIRILVHHDTEGGKNVQIKSLSMVVQGRDDVTLDLATDQAIAAAKEKTITIKEGCEYRLKITFMVNADVVSGLKYLQVVKRKGIKGTYNRKCVAMIYQMLVISNVGYIKCCIRLIQCHSFINAFYNHVVDKIEEMIGSYGPAATIYEKTFAPEEAPSGMLARGTYHVKSKFVDDDGTCWLEFGWGFAIKKEWES